MELLAVLTTTTTTIFRKVKQIKQFVYVIFDVSTEGGRWNADLLDVMALSVIDTDVSMYT
jgi:hypothetical protein